MKRILLLTLLIPFALNAMEGQSSLPTQCLLSISVDVFKTGDLKNDEKNAHTNTIYAIDGNGLSRRGTFQDSSHPLAKSYSIDNIQLACVRRLLKEASITYDLITPRYSLPRSQVVTIGETAIDQPMSNEVYLKVAVLMLPSK